MYDGPAVYETIKMRLSTARNATNDDVMIYVPGLIIAVVIEDAV